MGRDPVKCDKTAIRLRLTGFPTLPGAGGRRSTVVTGYLRNNLMCLAPLLITRNADVQIRVSSLMNLYAATLRGIQQSEESRRLRLQKEREAAAPRKTGQVQDRTTKTPAREGSFWHWPFHHEKNRSHHKAVQA